MTFIEKSSPMELSLPDFPEPIRLRFFADYDVRIVPEKVALLNPYQRVLFRAILSSSFALEEFARMSFEATLEEIPGAHLKGLFIGPSNEELWRFVMAYLPETEKGYWRQLKEQENDPVYEEIIAVLLVFDVTLCRAGVKERFGTGDRTIKLAGTTLDADTA